MLHPQGNPPPVLIDAPTGVDPDCGIWREYPAHTCTDRDGRPVTVGKSCWAAAREAVISAPRASEGGEAA